jgi:hypothetical protein
VPSRTRRADGPYLNSGAKENGEGRDAGAPAVVQINRLTYGRPGCFMGVTQGRHTAQLLRPSRRSLMTVHVDQDKCASAGHCVIAAPDGFDLRDEDAR